jgi:hypothetical protein
MTAHCKYCDAEILWEEQETEDGHELKWTPLDPLTSQRHRCRERKSIYVPKPFRCYRCNKPIRFDDSKVGKNGRRVPLDENGDPHRCPGR